MAKIVSQAQSVQISTTSTSRWFVRRDRRPIYSKCAPTAALPKPLSCLVARLLHRFWLVNEVVPDSDEGKITFQSDNGRHVVVLRLEVDEELCFNISNLIAFTNDATLWTGLDLSWGALAVNKILVQHARGPCYLALELGGQANAVISGDATFAGSRLIAWSPNSTSFCVSGIRRLGDVVLNEVLLSVSFEAADESAIVLLNSEMTNQSANGGNGILQFLKSVYWPF